MTRPLAGIRVVEVAMWAFVPTCGGALADLGAEVIKVEPPTGDPLRALKIGAIGGGGAIDYSSESYNRGKKSITLDLKLPEGREVLMRLCEGADVFLTSLLPPARRAMGIDAETIRARFPDIIYASGSATGPNGPESDKGGYDAITFWARGGLSATLTDDDADTPVALPGPAFGDSISGFMLAGAICAAIVKKQRTGEASTVDVSLLGAAMWTQQRFISQATADGRRRFPRRSGKPHNVLVNTYRTADARFVALCMLQSDKYWTRFCEVAGRPDLGADPRYATADLREEHMDACLADLTALFASKPLAEWRAILRRQDGQWDAVQDVGELHQDPQVQANGFIQQVDHGDGTTIPLVAVPTLFDGEALHPVRAPEVGEDSDSVLAGLGYDEDAIIDLKVKGVVF